MSTPDGSWRIQIPQVEGEAKKREAESQQSRAATEDLRTELGAASKTVEKITVKEDLKVFGLGVILFAAGALMLSMNSTSAYALFGSLILIVAGLVCFVLGFVYKYFGE